MTDAFVQVATGGTGLKIDTGELSVSGNTVERQRIVNADDTVAAALARVLNTAPASTDYGLVVRPAGDAFVLVNGASVTTVATQATQDATGYGWWQLQLTGTFVGTFLVESSNDNTNWSTDYGFLTGNSIPTTGTATANSFSSVNRWWGPCKGRYVRIRSSSFTSGTAVVTFLLRSVSPPVEYLNVGTVAGTVTTTPSAADGLVVLSGSAVASATTLATQDTSGGYGWWQLQLAGTFTFIIFIEVSHDNTNWTQVGGYTVSSSLPSSFASNFQSVGQSWGICKARYIRVRCASFTSSTSGAVTFVLRSTPPPVEYINVNVVTAPVTVAGSVTTSGTTGSGLVTTFEGRTTSHGHTSARIASGASTNLTAVKASAAGNLYSVVISNTSASVKYIKFFNAATTAAITLGTTAPIWTLMLPATTTTAIDLGTNPLRFSAGIVYATVTTAPDNGTTAIGADDLHGFLNYA